MTYSVQYDPQFFVPEPSDLEDVMELQVSPQPDWDDFKLFVDWFLQEIEGELKVADYGMDRHQVDFEKAGLRYLLNYEHYTQAIWIERS